MENKLTPELLVKAKQAKSPEELLALAKENDVAMDDESSKACYERLHKSGEVTDEELENVAGGACQADVTECPKCNAIAFSNGFCSSCGNYDWIRYIKIV